MRLLVTGGAGYVGNVVASERAHRLFGWRPTRGLAQMVTDTCEFARRMPDG